VPHVNRRRGGFCGEKAVLQKIREVGFVHGNEVRDMIIRFSVIVL